MCKTPPPKKFAKKARFVPPSNSELYVYFCNLHHVGMALWTLYTIVFGPRPYLLMTVGMYLYSDMYSALLHSVLDDKKALAIPGIAPVAKGFQEHHDFPQETTSGKGLLVLCSDTVRIQWVCAIFSLLIGRRDSTTFALVLLKLLCCAYGTQFGHYYAHNRHLCVGWLKPLSWLQDAHILLPPSHHWNHHKAPYSKNFGIVSGLSNFFLNPVLHPDNYQFYVILTLWTLFTMFDVAVIEQLVPQVAPATSSIFSAVANSTIYSAIEL